MKTFEELYDEISRWQVETFGNHDNPIPAFHHLKKEIDELQVALYSKNSKRKKDELSKTKLFKPARKRATEQEQTALFTKD